jgi:hypothetical protein
MVLMECLGAQQRRCPSNHTFRDMGTNPAIGNTCYGDKGDWGSDSGRCYGDKGNCPADAGSAM